MKTHNFKNTIIFLSATGLLAACNFPSQNHVKGTVGIAITEVTIPKTGQPDQNIDIHLTAQAPDGCHSDISIGLYEVDSRHFFLSATSFYESFGVCPTAIVEKDTTIYFKPTETGKYYFQTNASPFEVRLDTIVVN